MLLVLKVAANIIGKGILRKENRFVLCISNKVNVLAQDIQNIPSEGQKVTLVVHQMASNEPNQNKVEKINVFNHTQILNL